MIRKEPKHPKFSLPRDEWRADSALPLDGKDARKPANARSKRKNPSDGKKKSRVV